MKNKSPCYNCQKREIGCHGICEEYKAYSNKINKRNEIRREIRAKNEDVLEVGFALRNKLDRKYGRRK